MTIPEMRKKLGVTVFVFSETEDKNYRFLQAFVCVSIASRADNLVLVKFGFSALSVPRFFGV